MSCVGAARCEQSCYDEAKAHRTVINNFLDDMHRPALPYKFKFKFSGCPNDCMNSIQRADMAVIGTWRDNIRTDEALAKKWFAKHGMDELVNDVVARCPTKAIMLKETKDVTTGASISSVAINDTQSLEIDNHDCVRCMHCINVMTGALAPGKDKGATILFGGKRTLKIGDLMGTVIVPFMKLETDEDYEKLVELGQKHHRLLRRKRAGARAHRRDDRAHRPGQLPRRASGSTSIRTWSPRRAPIPMCAPTAGTRKSRKMDAAQDQEAAA